MPEVDKVDTPHVRPTECHKKPVAQTERVKRIARVHGPVWITNDGL
jgi:hypothetical protein